MNPNTPNFSLNISTQAPIRQTSSNRISVYFHISISKLSSMSNEANYHIKTFCFRIFTIKRSQPLSVKNFLILSFPILWSITWYQSLVFLFLSLWSCVQILLPTFLLTSAFNIVEGSEFNYPAIQGRVPLSSQGE